MERPVPWARISGSIFTIFPSLMRRPPDIGRTSVRKTARRCALGQSHSRTIPLPLGVWPAFGCFDSHVSWPNHHLLVRSQLLLLKYSLMLFKALFNYPILLQKAQKMSIQYPKMTIETRTMMITGPNWWGIPHFQTTQFWWLMIIYLSDQNYAFKGILHIGHTRMSFCLLNISTYYIHILLYYIYIHHHIPWYPILPVYFMYTCMYILIEKVGGCTGLTAISFLPRVLGKQTTVWPVPL